MSETTGESTARETAGTGTQERGFVGRLLSGLVRVREVSILIVLVALALYFQAANSAFLSAAEHPLARPVRRALRGHRVGVVFAAHLR